MRIKKSLVMLALLLTGGLMPIGLVSAQTFTSLHVFTPRVGSLQTNSDGSNPYAGVILSGDTLYGTTELGGSSGNGTVFSMKIDGTGFTNLYNFTGMSPDIYSGTNDDGALPDGGVILSGNTLYGTTQLGGTGGKGTIYSIHTDGSGFTNLHNFAPISGPPSYTNSDGSHSFGGLVQSGDRLYGTTEASGFYDKGTIFAINTDGSDFTVLHQFTSAGPPDFANSDGNYPYDGLILSGNTLYGTALNGGAAGNGTVFAINTDGSGFTNLHSFGPVTGRTSTGLFSNDDGAAPYGGLVLSGNTLYGTASECGNTGNGVVFAVNRDGTGFTKLHDFSGSDDGGDPYAGLTLSSNVLYGTTISGGSTGNGTVFAINTDGSSFATLYNFMDGLDGSSANAVIVSNNMLYGTAYWGGNPGQGTVFSLVVSPVAPQLYITDAGTNIVLTWSTINADGFTLQTAVDLLSGVWSTNLPTPVVVNGKNTVTVQASDARRFYRLRR
jgi:uncharacterized repeat protein (TIGR03803 family)